MQTINYYKDYSTFVKHIKVVRGFFKDGEWIGVEQNPKFTHANGVTRAEATKLYNEEVLRRKKRLSRNKIISKILDKLKPYSLLEHVEVYKTILLFMDILEKDFIDDKDLDYVLSNSEYFYNNIKNNETNKNQNNKTL